MSEFVTLKDVKKIYQMGEVEIMAAAGIDFEIKKENLQLLLVRVEPGKPQFSIFLAAWIRYLRAGAGRWTGYCYVFNEAADCI